MHWEHSNYQHRGWCHLRAVLPHTFRRHDRPTIVTSEQFRQPDLRGVVVFKRRSLIAAFLAAIAFGSGILNLITVMGALTEAKWRGAVFSLEFSRLSRTLTIL